MSVPIVRSRFITSLQVKLPLAFLGVALVPLGIVGLFAVRSADNLIESIVVNQLMNLAADKEQLIEKWIAERKADLDVVASSVAVKSRDTAKIGELLRIVQKHYQVYRSFTVADAEGKSIYSTEPTSVKSFIDEAWFQRAMAGASYMSPARLSADRRESVFQMAVPILDGSGRPQGVCPVRPSVLRPSLKAC